MEIDSAEIRALGHYPVMYREIMRNLDESANTGSIIIDCTMGSGGHTGLILKYFPKHRVISFERDREIADIARQRLVDYADRHRIVQDNYSNIDLVSEEAGKVSGIVYDLGISTWHYECNRGFAFKNDSPLDMRLDDGCNYTAADVVNGFSEAELSRIFFEFGEERYSRRIARAIVAERGCAPITHTGALVHAVMKGIPPQGKRHEGIHPATRVFQALRIFVNNELDTIASSLEKAWSLLAPGGRLMVISFHSLEDRIVKTTMRSLASGCDCGMRDCVCGKTPKVKLLGKKPVLPAEDEIAGNKPSRSAKLRVCERI